MTGHLSEEQYDLLTRSAPILCVDVVPRFVDRPGNPVLLIERLDYAGRLGWCSVGGRVWFNERIAEAAARHIRSTLGPGVQWESPGCEKPHLLVDFERGTDLDVPHDGRKHSVSMDGWWTSPVSPSRATRPRGLSSSRPRNCRRPRLSDLAWEGSPSLVSERRSLDGIRCDGGAAGRVTAEQLVQSEAEHRRPDRAAGGDGRERRADGAPQHALLPAQRADQAADRELMVDHEILLVAGILHDIGLYDGASEGGVYTTDGAHFAKHLLAGRPGWDGAPARALPRGDRAPPRAPQPVAGGPRGRADAPRRHDRALQRAVNFGVSRGWIRGLWRAVPRDGLYGEVGKMVAKAARERPTSLPKILVRGH